VSDPAAPYRAAPEPRANANARRTTTLVVAILLAVGLALIAVLLPVPYIELSPGVSCNTLAQCREAGVDQNVLSIDPKVKQYPTNDKLFFTTVAVGGAPGEARLTLLDALRGWFDSSSAVIPKDLLYPSNASSAQIDCENLKDQQSSQNSATIAALRQLKYKVPVETDVYVDTFAPNSPAAAAGIEICDDIVSINGTPVTSEKQLTQLVGQHKVGDVVQVGYDRDGKRGVVNVRLTGTTRRPLIGIAPQTISIAKPPFKVSFDVGGVGGPSAGLMYALAIIDRLTPGDLTGGVAVAGTGEISDDGKVGPIGGIAQKLLTARSHGATVFLVPGQNCSEAAHAKPKGLRLATVNSLSDALSVLAALRHEPGGVIHDCTG
jgi:PDZ domain-containing protein